MSDPKSGRSQISALARDRVIKVLSSHFANDRLDVAEFERRVDAVHRARTVGELQALVADLQPPGVAGRGDTSQVVRGAAESAARAAAPAESSLERRGHRFVIAIFGGATRRGAWTPAPRTVAIACMGGVELDFREIQLPPGVTEVTVVAIMGGVDIIVPPDLAMEVDGLAIMGAFEQVGTSEAQVGPDMPLLRIGGFVLMGGVDVQVRLPGESARDARARRRAERKARKRLERGRET